MALPLLVGRFGKLIQISWAESGAPLRGEGARQTQASTQHYRQGMVRPRNSLRYHLPRCRAYLITSWVVVCVGLYLRRLLRHFSLRRMSFTYTTQRIPKISAAGALIIQLKGQQAPSGPGTQVLRTPAAHALEMGRHHSGLRTAGRAQDAHCGARGFHTPLGESTNRNY